MTTPSEACTSITERTYTDRASPRERRRSPSAYADWVTIDCERSALHWRFPSIAVCRPRTWLNVMLITPQPDEGFSVTFNVKSPDHDSLLDPQNLHFSYAHSYGPLPDGYQTLILDIIQGDQTLFVRADEVEASWKVYAPLFVSPQELHSYDAGSWGPAAMDRRLALADEQWTGR